MPTPAKSALSAHDRDILRRLGARLAAAAETPQNRERRDAWYALDSGDGNRVMVLAEHGGIRDAQRPAPPNACADPWARDIEGALRSQLYEFETLRDDHVVEPVINVGWRVSLGDYGVPITMHQGGDDVHMGSRVWDAPIRDLDRDLDRLRPRAVTVDRETTLTEQARERISGC